MLKRWLSLALLLAAGLPIAYGLRILPLDRPRAAAIMATSGVVAALALLIAVGRAPRPSAWLKFMGLAMCVILTAAVGGMGYTFDRVKAAELENPARLRNLPARQLAELQTQMHAEAQAYRTLGRRLYILAGTLAGCGVVVALLPVRPGVPARAAPAGSGSTPRSDRVD